MTVFVWHKYFFLPPAPSDFFNKEMEKSNQRKQKNLLILAQSVS